MYLSRTGEDPRVLLCFAVFANAIETTVLIFLSLLKVACSTFLPVLLFNRETLFLIMVIV